MQERNKGGVFHASRQIESLYVLFMVHANLDLNVRDALMTPVIARVWYQLFDGISSFMLHS